MDKFNKLIEKADQLVADQFQALELLERKNQKKVLDAFRKNKVSEAHFVGSCGYGYNDVGRETLDAVFKDTFCAEAALVRPHFASGTHALCVALFSVLRPGDTLLSATGSPYDTLNSTIRGEGKGSLADFGISYKQVDLKNGAPDLSGIEDAVRDKSVKLVLLQRSRGYELRPSLWVEQLEQICDVAKKAGKLTMIDNCYGEFTEEREPCDFADLTVGSLIKNPGGGLALTGGYIAGKGHLVHQAADRLFAPSIGMECGATMGNMRNMFQGFFMAPHATVSALKTAAFCSCLMSLMGYQVLPLPGQGSSDIITSIVFGDRQKLISFVRGIQAASPVDSHAVPYPAPMPGYEDQVIMAAGGFVQGASLEISADAPIRPPYICYLQGGLSYEIGRLAVIEGASYAYYGS